MPEVRTSVSELAKIKEKLNFMPENTDKPTKVKSTFLYKNQPII